MKMFVFIIVTILSTPALSATDYILPIGRELTTNYNQALEAIFGMGIRLQALLDEESNENFVVSPISATVVVGQLMLGADGLFRDQLYELLSLPHYQYNEYYYFKNKNISNYFPYLTLHLQLRSLLKQLEGNTNLARQFLLKQKSGLFYDRQIKLKQEFMKNLQNFYSTNLYNLDLNNSDRKKVEKSIEFMNEWVYNNTNGLIKTIINQNLSPDTVSIFANTIYFYGEWEQPFSRHLNIIEEFSITDQRQINVTYMRRYFDEILYTETDDFQLVGLPYKNNELTMFIILPKPDHPYRYKIKKFIQNLRSADVLGTISKAKRINVFVKLPKFKLTNTVYILNQLKKYQQFKKQDNINNTESRDKSIVDKLETRIEAFSNYTTNVTSDIYLTNAAINQQLKINEILQQVVFSLDEKGTEAGVVSVSIIDYINDNANFIVDRPFVFFIRHEQTLATLFWGSISNPIESNN